MHSLNCILGKQFWIEYRIEPIFGKADQATHKLVQASEIFFGLPSSQQFSVLDQKKITI